MARQDVRTDDQIKQQSSRSEASGAQPSGSQQSGQQQGSLTRRTGYNPFALSLTPTEFFMNPFSLMRRMTEELDRAFSESGSGRGTNAGVLWAPTIEVFEREGKYVVHADLPGLKPEDVKVEVTGDSLVLEGERKIEREEDQGGVHRTERRYGRFYRAIPLPEGAKADEARANFENGVLEIEVPVPQRQSNSRQIPIESKSAAAPATSNK